MHPVLLLSTATYDCTPSSRVQPLQSDQPPKHFEQPPTFSTATSLKCTRARRCRVGRNWVATKVGGN
eukprot:scaffold62243_cov16-Tisochrysis_lutea.AAC.2